MQETRQANGINEAGISCPFACSPVPAGDLFCELPWAEKIITLQTAAAIYRRSHSSHWRTVLVNGCFDLLHIGHIAMLQQARMASAAAMQRGTDLVVLLNSDRAVRQLKGSGRPVIPERQRALCLASLAVVDAVVIIDDVCMADAMSAIAPGIYYKPGYTPDTQDPAERAALLACGARLIMPPVNPAWPSTTAIIGRICALEGTA